MNQYNRYSYSAEEYIVALKRIMEVDNDVREPYV
jgi:hypothetical protein